MREAKYKMVPGWMLTIIFGFFAILASIAVAVFFEKLYHQCVWLGFCSLFFLLLYSALHVRNDLIEREKTLQEEKRTISTAEVIDVLDKLPQQEPIAKDPKTDPLRDTRLKRARMGGIILEGRRNNLIPSTWFNSDVRSDASGTKSISRIVSGIDAPEYIFKIKPKKALKLNMVGRTKLPRKDYTFSFLCYTVDNDFSQIQLKCSISSGPESVSSVFGFQREHVRVKIGQLDLKVFRPEVSHLFTSVPKTVICSIVLQNNSDQEFEFIFTFPMIEEGLFSSHPIPCGQRRGGEFLYYGRPRMLFGSDEGTLSFFFQPYWGAKELTPGISPHFFSCFTDDEANGVKIYSDSDDNGKIKVEIARDGTKRYVSSDLVPQKGEVYSVAFRWKENIGQLVVSGRNVSSGEKLLLPTHPNLPPSIFLGCSPKSEDLSAFSVFKDFKIYSKWLSDRLIRSEIFRSLPDIFPEFEKDARLLSEP